MSYIKRFLRLGLGTVGAIVGIGSGLDSMFGGSGGGGSSGGNAPGGTYVPTGRGTADTNWQELLPLIAQSIQQQQQNVSGPVNAGYAATQPGGQFGNLGTILQQFGNQLAGMGQQGQTNAAGLTQAGNQVWNTALDPQNALRSQLEQQVTDASRAGTSARGIGMSGEAAGIENQDVNNFLINWQNQQLGRQLAALQGMGGAMGQAANQYNQVGRDLSGASGLYTTGMNLPFAAAQSYTGAMGAPGSQFAQLSPQILGYLGLGNQASGQAFNQNQIGLNNLTSGLSQLGSMFNQTQPAAPVTDLSTQAPGYGGAYGP